MNISGRSIRVTVGASLAGLLLVLFPNVASAGDPIGMGSITGYVNDANQERAPLEGVSVAATSGESPLNSDETDANGQYSLVIQDTPREDVLVTFSKDGYLTRSALVNVVDVDAGITFLSTILAQDADVAGIDGSVTDTITGLVVADATLTATDTYDWMTATDQSDEVGEYLLEDLTPDYFQVEASAPGYYSTQQTGSPSPGSIQTLDFGLVPTSGDAPVGSFRVVVGTKKSGNLSSLRDDDDDYLKVGSEKVGSKHKVLTNLNFLVVPNESEPLTLIFKSKNSRNCQQALHIKDWNDGTWTRLKLLQEAGPTEKRIKVVVPDDGGDYVAGGFGFNTVSTRFTCVRSDRFVSSLDQARLRYAVAD